MKNQSTFIAKAGVSDADLMRAARDMYDALEIVLNHPLSHLNSVTESAVRAALAKARGQL